MSVWFLEGMSLIVKLKVISPKSEGKEKMKVVFVDEIVGLTSSGIPPQMMEQFQRTRKKGYEFKNRMLVE